MSTALAGDLLAVMSAAASGVRRATPRTLRPRQRTHTQAHAHVHHMQILILDAHKHEDTQPQPGPGGMATRRAADPALSRVGRRAPCVRGGCATARARARGAPSARA
eukprot:527324-Prymnesium_polylepis.1